MTKLKPPLSQGWAFKEALAILLLVGLPAASGFSLFGMTELRIEEVMVPEHLERVPVSWIEEQVAFCHGSHLLLLSAQSVRERLERHPWIESVRVQKQLPRALRLLVVERRPAVLLTLRDGGLIFVDGDGRRIAPPRTRLEQELAETLPVVRVKRRGSLPGALVINRAVATVLPELHPQLEEIVAQGANSYIVRFASPPFMVVVDSNDAEEGLARLAMVLPEIRRRYRRPLWINVQFSREVLLSLGGEPVSAEPDEPFEH